MKVSSSPRRTVRSASSIGRRTLATLWLAILKLAGSVAKVSLFSNVMQSGQGVRRDRDGVVVPTVPRIEQAVNATGVTPRENHQQPPSNRVGHAVENG